MIPVLIAVIDDLFQFASQGLSGAVPVGSGQKKTIDTYQQKLEKIQFNNSTKPPSSQVQTLTDIASVLPSNTKKQTNTPEAFKIGFQYFIGDIDVFFYNDPVLAFDGSLQSLRYGTQVRLVSISGRWAQVRLAGRIGWVFKDVLLEQADAVYPHFTTGVEHDSHHAQTVKLRACIDDLFGGARGEHALSPVEYVHYRLQQKRRMIDWGDIRMRIPGTWQRKLRGRAGVHIGISPKTESVMEYSIDDMGYLAFVESVSPDESIHLTQIGKNGSNQYTDQTLNEAQWKELRPVFIEVE